MLTRESIIRISFVCHDTIICFLFSSLQSVNSRTNLGMVINMWGPVKVPHKGHDRLV